MSAFLKSRALPGSVMVPAGRYKALPEPARRWLP